ncbi:MAG TPA: hypothetical protein DCO82_09545 [Alphaproteobacteria bacterium]|nr:hypothetical protein [Alphaproteobacteria bacterium]
MKKAVYAHCSAGLIGAVVLLGMTGEVLAQEDTERAMRIRAQMGAPVSVQTVENELKGLRYDINSNLGSLSERLMAIEQDMVDLKARLRVLEVRAQTGGRHLNTEGAASGNSP